MIKNIIFIFVSLSTFFSLRMDIYCPKDQITSLLKIYHQTLTVCACLCVHMCTVFVCAFVLSAKSLDLLYQRFSTKSWPIAALSVCSIINQKAWQLNSRRESSKFANTQKNNSRRIANKQKNNITFTLYIIHTVYPKV